MGCMGMPLPPVGPCCFMGGGKNPFSFHEGSRAAMLVRRAQGQSWDGEPLPCHGLPSPGIGPYTVIKLTPTPGDRHRFLNTDAAELLRFRVGWGGAVFF